MLKLLACALSLTCLSLAPSALADSTAGFDTNELVVRGDVSDQVISVTHNSNGSYTVTDNTGITPSTESYLTGCTQAVGDPNTVNCTTANVADMDIRVLSDYDYVPFLSDGGVDVINLGVGQTAAEWGAANAYVDGGPQWDDILGSPSEARAGENEADYLNGGAGDDRIDGRGGDDFITGGSNSLDTQNGELSGGDILFGGPGSDTIMDGDGPVNGDDGNSSATFNVGEDRLDGGICPAEQLFCSGAGTEATSDSDTLAYSDDRQFSERRAGVGVDLGNPAGEHGQTGEGDVIDHFENVIGTGHTDDLAGSAAVNVIDARGGNDLVDSADSVADSVDCGDGTADTLARDLADVDVFGCEGVDPAFAAPDAPTGLAAVATPGGAIALDWNDVSGATEYAVYAKDGSGYPGYPDSPVAYSTLSFRSISGVAAGVTYCFKVATIDENGTSALSDEACATALPATGGAGGGGGTTGAGSGGASTATGPTPAQIAALTSANATTAARQLVKTGLFKLLRDGVVATGNVPKPGRIKYTVYYLVGSFKASASAKKRQVLATGSKTLRSAGRYRVKLKPSKKARKRLRRAKRVKGQLVIEYTPAGGRKVTRKKNVTLKRR